MGGSLGVEVKSKNKQHNKPTTKGEIFFGKSI